MQRNTGTKIFGELIYESDEINSAVAIKMQYSYDIVLILLLKMNKHDLHNVLIK